MDDATLLILSRQDAARLMRPADYLVAVEAAFRSAAQGRPASPPPMQMLAKHGGFHAKAALFDDGARSYAALKLNANFPGNFERHGLPTIQGVILLFDAVTGAPLAIMDSIEVTLRRTAAATALAARLLARPNSRSVAICGCGAQARPQLEALVEVLPLSSGAVFDHDSARADALANFARASLGLELKPAASHQDATLGADVVVTCTPSKAAFLGLEDVSPGCFIAAVGADAPYKSEIRPALMQRAAVFADVLEQCVVMGDLKHAIEAGVLTAQDVRGDMAQLVSGAVKGRLADDEFIIFDSTGTGLQDAASAAMLYARASESGAGTRIRID
jgi:ornithine cyclodeaminase/alanine dehydrogenase-like protein (mu-crystallin family)